MMRFPYLLVFLALAACNQSGTGSAPAKTAAAPPAAYTCPAPWKGKYSEVNSGKFDLVDGIANDENGGTVVYVPEKQIASPVLADSTCAMAQARSLALLRNSGYIQVRLNADGSASYFEAGTPYHGQMIDQAGRAVRVGGATSPACPRRTSSSPPTRRSAARRSRKTMRRCSPRRASR